MMLRKFLAASTVAPVFALFTLACGGMDGDDGVAGGAGGAFGVGGVASGGSSSGGAHTGGAFSGAGEAGAGGDASTGGDAAGGTFAGGFVEDEGTDCSIPALPDAGDLPAVGGLPDPFEKLDGTRIASRAEWRCRRQEIRMQAEKYIYGTKPPKPDTVTGTVSGTSVDVQVSHGGKNASFSASVSLPSGGGPGPYPAMVTLGEFGVDSALIRAEGVAIINYNPFAVGMEGTGRANKQGAFYTIYGADSSTGLLAAWAWGVSRIIDVIEASDGAILNAEAVGVTGCSRFGKGAFAVGAFDQRIPLTVPFESGSAGVPIYRGIPGEGAQSLSSAYGEQPWLGDAFGAFTSDATKLPVDTHSVVAMFAPRGLFIMDNPHIANLGPRSAHVAALAGAEVYEALGVGDNISYHSAVESGTHCAARAEHAEPLRQHIRKFLLKTGDDAGVISAAGKATGALSDWRAWSTPALD